MLCHSLKFGLDRSRIRENSGHLSDQHRILTNSATRELSCDKALVYDDVSKQVETKVTRTDLGQAYQGINDLGIDALPLIVDRIKHADYDLLPLFGELTGGEGVTHVGSLEERISFTLEWWETNKKDWLLPPGSAAKLKDQP